MSDAQTGRGATPTAAPRPGIPLGRFFGIQLMLDFSVVLIFALVVFSLATGAFPAWHPNWGAALRWGTALLTGLLFFASIVVHELAHALVARLRGIRVPRITLFLFGGISEMEDEPDRPLTEFLVAVVGPITSVLLGFLFAAIGIALAGTSFAETIEADPERALSQLGPATTALLWLAPINLALGVFNLLPGFPLDGGRVLRAGLWAATGDLVKATRWSTAVGQGLGWLLVALGFLRGMRGDLFGGLWIALIGIFLARGARDGLTQVVVRKALAGLSVRDLMRTHFETATASMSLQDFLDQHVLRSGQTAWPVVDGAGFRGMVTFDQVVAVPAALRPTHHLGELLPGEPEGLPPDLPGQEALTRLARSGREALAVLEQGRLVGLLYGTDVARWLVAHEGAKLA